jgi:transposase
MLAFDYPSRPDKPIKHLVFLFIQQALIKVDKGGFHSSLNLNIPEKVILLFQPAYSPEVNPRERLWGYLKEQLKCLRFDNIEELRAAVQKELKNLTNEIIASLTGWEFILEAISVARL